MPNAIMLAFTGPTSPETEDDYNRWYNDKHLHDVASITGVKSATRWRIVHEVEVSAGVPAPPQAYLAIYEITGETPEDLAAFAGRLTEALESGQADIHPALDASAMGAAVCLPVSEVVLGVSADEGIARTAS